MDFLKNLGLDENKKYYLQKLFLESTIRDVNLIQNKLYIELMDSKIIILKNCNLNTYNIIKKYQNEDFFKKNFKSNYLKHKKFLRTWQHEEINFLKKYYFSKTLEELSMKTKKSFYQISIKVLELKLVEIKKWKCEELDFLKKNIELSNYELAKLLKRSIHSIKSKKRTLKITYKNSRLQKM
ncbi:MAG: hypothetical protein ACRC3I_00465 [Cetobacterium sp.]